MKIVHFSEFSMTNFNVFIPWCHYHVMSLFQSSNSLFYSSRPCFSFCWSTLLKQTNIPISPSAQNLCNNFMNNILSVPIFCRSSPELIHHSSVISFLQLQISLLTFRRNLDSFWSRMNCNGIVRIGTCIDALEYFLNTLAFFIYFYHKRKECRTLMTNLILSA